MTDQAYVDKVLARLHAIDPTAKLVFILHDDVTLECDPAKVEACRKLLSEILLEDMAKDLPT